MQRKDRDGRCGPVTTSASRAGLTVPPTTPPGEVWRYGLAHPFQVAAERAARLVDIRGNRGHDLAIGTDVEPALLLRDARAEVLRGGAAAPQAGTCLEELTPSGRVVPLWNF